MKLKAILLMLTGLTLILAACAAPTPAPTSAPTQPPADTAAPAATNTSAPAADTPAAGTSAVSFSKDIQPILQNRCFNCHGGQSTREGLSVASYETLMAGSNNGPVIAPGDPANSLLVQLVQKGKMPKRGPKLTPAEVQLIIDWITAGALNN